MRQHISDTIMVTDTQEIPLVLLKNSLPHMMAQALCILLLSNWYFGRLPKRILVCHFSRRWEWVGIGNVGYVHTGRRIRDTYVYSWMGPFAILSKLTNCQNTDTVCFSFFFKNHCPKYSLHSIPLSRKRGNVQCFRSI